MGGNTGGNRTARFSADAAGLAFPPPVHGQQPLREPHRSPRRPIAGGRLRARRARRRGRLLQGALARARRQRRAAPALEVLLAPRRGLARPGARRRDRAPRRRARDRPRRRHRAPRRPDGRDRCSATSSRSGSPTTPRRTPASATRATRCARGTSTSSRGSAGSALARSPTTPASSCASTRTSSRPASPSPPVARRSRCFARCCAGDGAVTRERSASTCPVCSRSRAAKRRRLIRAADPVAVERIIEAVLNRPHRDPLGPVRDAALVAAMGFTVAARPSEWLGPPRWRDVREGTVELQAVQNELGDESDAEVGLKTGARAGAAAAQRLRAPVAYRRALEARFGLQPDNALVFQEVSKDGPLWYEDGFPVEWSADHYKRWTARVLAPGAPGGGAGTRHRGLDRRAHLLRAAPQRDLDGAALDARDEQGRHEPAHACRPTPVTTSRRCSATTRTSSLGIATRSRSTSRPSVRLLAHRVESAPFEPAEEPPGPQREAQRRRRARTRTARDATGRWGSAAGPRAPVPAPDHRRPDRAAPRLARGAAETRARAVRLLRAALSSCQVSGVDRRVLVADVDI